MMCAQTIDLETFWESALAEIELQISRPNFITWFKNSKLIQKQDGVALVALPNNFSKEWIENRYAKVILKAIRELDETTKKVNFIVTSRNTDTATKNKNTIIKESSATGQLSFSEFHVDPETNLNQRYNLSSFIVGKSNELAFAAGQAIIQKVGAKYNPLFVYGGVGLGKTHLIQAVGNEIKNRYRGKVRVKYVSSERFTNDVIWAIRNKRMETIKEKYRLIDVLIIDDIQFIGGKTATEEEFFHTFNALYEHNKQIIISSDRAPKFIPTLEERLRSRFEGGMIVDVGYPDYELRYAIIKTKLQEQCLLLPDEVMNLIATNVQRNIRELEGVIHRIAFLQSRQHEQITVIAAERIINEMVQKPIKSVSVSQVIKAVAEFYEVSPNDILNRSRKKEIAESRQVVMYLLREMLNLSYPHIGRKLGKRDHTTAIYAYEKISKELQRNINLTQRMLAIKELIEKEVSS